MNRRIPAVTGVVVGTVLILFGLLFLVGSAGKARRLAVAGIALALGGVTAGLGGRAWNRAEELLPERLEAAILELAKREDGEVGQEEIEAHLGWRAPHAREVLDRMILDGTCRRVARSGTFHFVFPEIQPRLVLLVCSYCGAEHPLSSAIQTCPKCGGPVERKVVARSLAEGAVFAMDEEDSPEQPGPE